MPHWFKLALHTSILSADFLTLSKETQANSRLNATTSPDFPNSVNCLQSLARFLLGFCLKICVGRQNIACLKPALFYMIQLCPKALSNSSTFFRNTSKKPRKWESTNGAIYIANKHLSRNKETLISLSRAIRPIWTLL